MPKSVKRVYQGLNITFILMVLFLTPMMFHSDKNSILTYGVAIFSLLLLGISLIVSEYTMKINSVLSTILYVFSSLLLPLAMLFLKFKMMVLYTILLILIPLLIYNLYKKRNSNYSFKVENYYLINLIYIFNTFSAIMILMLKENYWSLSIILILLSVYIELIIYSDLKKAQLPIMPRAYLTGILTALMFLLAYYGEIISTLNVDIQYNKNLIYPVLSLIFLAVLSKINRRNTQILILEKTTK